MRTSYYCDLAGSSSYLILVQAHAPVQSLHLGVYLHTVEPRYSRYMDNIHVVLSFLVFGVWMCSPHGFIGPACSLRTLLRQAQVMRILNHIMCSPVPCIRFLTLALHSDSSCCTCQATERQSRCPT